MRAPSLLFFALVLCLSWPLRAQNLPLTALPFLEISASPSVNALGGAGVARPDADPYGFLLNPAQLGLAARDMRATSAFYPEGSTAWLAVGDLHLGSSALNVGFAVQAAGVPLTVGVGIGQTALRFGERTVVNAQGESVGGYEPVDRYRALGLGVATTGPVRLGLGTTVRHVVSTDRVTVDEQGVETSNVWGLTFDAGFMAEADVMALVGQPTMGGLRPALSVSAGYSQANIGGMVAYSGSNSQPLPRVARLGWAGSAGLDLPTTAGPLRLFEAAVSVQAEHSLVRRADDGSYRYEPVLGDLNVIQNAFLGRGNEVVTGRSGVQVMVGETVGFSRGRFDGWGFSEVATRGLEVRLAGPLKAAAALTGSASLVRLASQFDVRYTRSVYFAGDLNESTFNGVTLVVGR